MKPKYDKQSKNTQIYGTSRWGSNLGNAWKPLQSLKCNPYTVDPEKRLSASKSEKYSMADYKKYLHD